MVRPTKEHSTTTNIEWFKSWLEERSRFPSLLAINLPAPLKVDEEMSVLVYSERNGVYSEGFFGHPGGSPIEWELLRPLIGERLTKNTASRLESFLLMIKELQGLNFPEGLAYMVQMFLLTTDYLRATNFGEKSVVLNPCWDRSSDSSENSKIQSNEKNEKDRQRKWQHYISEPVWRLESLLTFWNHRGGKFAKGIIKSPDGQPGKPNYLYIPPMWVPLDQLKKLYGNELESLQIPILVNSSYRPLVESMIDCYDTHAQSNIPMKITVGATAQDNLQPVEQVDQNLFQRQGDVWTISHQKTTIYLKNLKGLRYLAYLLSNPGQLMTPLHLIALVDSPTASSGKGQTNPQELENETLNIQGKNDGDEVLDQKAVKDYKARLGGLRQEIAEAEANNDRGTLERLSGEEQWILDELKRSTGLGGTSRTFPAPNTKANKAVSNTIRNSLARIEKKHPALAAHLHNALRLGATCVYQPESPTHWMV